MEGGAIHLEGGAPRPTAMYSEFFVLVREGFVSGDAADDEVER